MIDAVYGMTITEVAHHFLDMHYEVVHEEVDGTKKSADFATYMRGLVPIAKEKLGFNTKIINSSDGNTEKLLMEPENIETDADALIVLCEMIIQLSAIGPGGGTPKPVQ